MRHHADTPVSGSGAHAARPNEAARTASGPATDSLSEAQQLVAAAARALGHDPLARSLLSDCADRLRQPLRVALAGSIKAGKSTLLNALVGQSIAPTDATECTRVVTWYRTGATPMVTAYAATGASANVVVRRGAGSHGLTFEMNSLRWNPAGDHTVDHLEVRWPTAELSRTTIIDTPGTSSLSRDVSERTMRLLTPADVDADAVTIPGADAVVYLLRRLDATDVHFLEQLGAGGQAGHLGVVGVVSRADEISAGRIDALESARDVASRFATELERTGLCQAVIPVAGLLAFAAATLTQPEFAAFAALAALPPETLELAMLSADRFSRPDIDLPVSPLTRAQLLDRFGMFGVRMATELVRTGVRDAATLSAELTARSGIDDLRTVLDVQFGQRADQLKAHSALTTLDRVITAHPGTAADQLLPRIRTLLADVHGFAELRLLGRLRTDDLPLPPDDRAELFRLIGGAGVAPHVRLGLPADSDPETLRTHAIAAAHKWHTRSRHPLIDKATVTACLTAVRSAEGALTQLPG
ncbi:dynamin family protein [Nocardia sp. NPDC058658]|uniref:dynamin family protein n=1 Tax=Nocardia sp. NPDC058658 TaxID=3346580 RepID=UPI003658823E